MKVSLTFSRIWGLEELGIQLSSSLQLEKSADHQLKRKKVPNQRSKRSLMNKSNRNKSYRTVKNKTR